MRGVIRLMEIMIFNNEKFGEIRIIEVDGNPWFMGKDIASILNYTNTAKAIRDHVDEIDKLRERIVLSGQNREVIFINESGLYSLILSSKLPSAKEFKRWVTSEVLPSIRKTSSYTIKKEVPTDYELRELAVREREAKISEAQLWEKLGVGCNETFQQICKTYAMNTLAEKEIVELPVVSQKTYTATEIGDILGISANRVGKLTNKYGLKTSMYGQWYHDKSKYPNKEIETFRYYNNVIDVLKSYI